MKKVSLLSLKRGCLTMRTEEYKLHFSIVERSFLCSIVFDSFYDRFDTVFVICF